MDILIRNKMDFNWLTDEHIAIIEKQFENWSIKNEKNAFNF